MQVLLYIERTLASKPINCIFAAKLSTRSSTPPYMYPTYKKIALIAAPLLFAFMLMLPAPAALSPAAWKVLACMAWMLLWWFTEATPIPATSLLPIVLFPALGIASAKDAASPYASPIVYLFMGGFFIALAMERSGLHKRIALTILKLTGSTANGIIAGFMLGTGILSMWVSNTATTVMMLPIAASVVTLIENNPHITPQQFRMFALSLMLSIAYAANIGGMGTLIGTPPNIVFAGFMQKSLNIQVGFLQWMLVGVPVAAVMLALTYLLLTKFIYPNHIGSLSNSKRFIDEQIVALGTLSKAEKSISAIFFVTALGWIFRPQIESLLQLLLPNAVFTDTTVALIGGLLCFVLPINFKEGDFLLRWEDSKKLPWGILLLFGGGLSLADAMEKAGIVELIGKTIASGNYYPFLLLLILTALIVYLTELMSNVALLSIMLPVVAGIAEGANIPVALLAVPVTLGSSAAFMLPMGTPPNAIVFASGYITMPQMARAGMWLNLVTVATMTTLGYALTKLVFGSLP